MNTNTNKRGILIHVLAVASIIFVGERAARADFVFGTPTNLGPVVNSPYGDGCGFVSSDSLELYFSSGRPPGAPDNWDLWVTTRETTDTEWGTPVHLGAPLSTPYDEWIECGSNDGMSLFLVSNRPGGYGNYDIWVASRVSKDENWDQPVNLGPAINSADDDFGATISSDGLTLFIAQASVGSLVGDILVSKRDTVNDDWSSPVNLGPIVNESSEEMFPSLSTSGIHLLFSDNQFPIFREGGLGGGDIWMTMRVSTEGDWSIPSNLGPQINSPAWDGWPCISTDGSILYFSSKRTGGLGGYWGDIWQASIEPIVDLNGDGIVDAVDMCLIVDNWGTGESLCDIGPTPFGDGIVDVQDLIVLAEHLFEEFPPAEPVE